MDIILNAKVKAKDDQTLSIPAKRILEKTKDIPSDANKLKRRWFWELLQNASDYNDEVNVILELFDDKVVFKHDGKPFKASDARNLIAPDSGKDEDELEGDTIGQFGTGFISTHVLSGVITVKGIVNVENSHERFSFNLDRRGFNNKDFLKQSISDSTEQYEKPGESIFQYNRGFDSIFEYDLKSPLESVDSTDVVKSGLEYVYEILPYTLGFVKKVRSVSIRNYNTNFIDQKEIKFKPQFINDDEFFICIDKQSKEGIVTKEEKKFIISKEGETTVIVGVKQGRIIPYPKNITKLFCSLPMIGTENFPLPVVTNSPSFKPKTERDGIRLTSVEEKNRLQLENSLKAYKSLISKLISRNIKDGYNYILSWDTLSFEDPQEKYWFQNNIINSLKAFLLRQKIVKNSQGEMIDLQSLKVPYFPKLESNKEKLHSLNDLVSDYFPAVTVPKADFLNWYESLDFNEFKLLKYTLEDLLKQVNVKPNLASLDDRITNSEYWLKKLQNLILTTDDKLLDQYKVIPNQMGDLVLRKDNINWDSDVDPELINIHDLLACKDYREQLVHKDYEDQTGLISQDRFLDSRKAAKTIDDLFSEVPENERTGVSFQRALRAIFSWFTTSINNGTSESELNDWFKWFSKKKPQLFLETFDDVKRDQIFAIAQSEKYDSLSELAESDISNEELKVISSNAKAVLALSKTIEAVPDGINMLIQYAKLMQKDQEDFEFKNKIGKKVEEVLYSALSQAGLNQGSFSVNYDGMGAHDFEIKNNLNYRKFYIELKSYSSSSFGELHLAPSQAKFAKSRNDNYSLSVIERPQNIEDVTLEYLRNNLKSKLNIEELVNNGVSDYDQFESIKVGGNLHLTLRDKVRIKVKKDDVLNSPLSFDELINRIKSYLS